MGFILKKEIQCKYCDTKFNRKIYGNYSVRCPRCYRLLEHLSDFGCGPVTPFYISVGEELFGVVECRGYDYFLSFNGEEIKLKTKYFDAVHEAEKYITDNLNISIMEIETNIVTKRGSLWFFGESFGRPGDNIHRVKSITYDGEILIIVFDQWEELFVYNPEDIVSNQKELKIANASKVKWSYFPYGNYNERKTITYFHRNEEIIKLTKNGEKTILNDSKVPAIMLAGY